METWQLEQLETEAAARITWGDPPAEVRTWLLSSGIEAFYADAIMRDCLRRRATEMRLLGTRNLIRGVAALGVAGILAIGGWLMLESLAQLGARAMAGMYGIIFLPAAFIGGYGIWQAWLALDRLVFGVWADGAVSDVE